MEEESTSYETTMKQSWKERNELLDRISQLKKDVDLAKEILEQRHSIIQEKVFAHVSSFSRHSSV